jgi:hypothetical protein
MPTKSGAYVYYEDGSNAAQVHVANQTDTIIQPIEIQSHYAQTIQTHNAVSVAISTWSNGSWIDTDGFNSLDVTLLNDNTTASALEVHWSNDGVTLHAKETGIVSATGNNVRCNVNEIPTKARYVRISVNNADSALAHTMSAWAYLKA